MELSNAKRLTKHIFRLLKVDEIIIPIGRTNKGNLGIRFSQNSDEYEIMLDSIPLTTSDFLKDDNNIELKKMMDKYLFDSAPLGGTLDLSKMISPYEKEVPETPMEIMNAIEPISEIITTEGLQVDEGKPLKKRGRPAGSKNKVTTEETEVAKEKLDTLGDSRGLGIKN